IFERMCAEVLQASATRQLALGELCGDPGQQHLAALGDCSEPGAAVDSGAVIVAVAQFNLAGVYGHAYADRRAGRPLLDPERVLQDQRGGDGIARMAEDSKDTV